jgi:MFS family permease
VFIASNIAMVIAGTILGIQLLGLSLFLQQSWHWSTITTGLALAPLPAAVLGASFIAPRLHQRFPIGAVVASGFVLSAVGQVLMILTLHHGVHNYAAAILPGWVVIGFGLGFTAPTIIASATVDLPPEQSATGSAVVKSARQFGGVFGASILVVVLGKAEVTGDPSRFYELWWFAVALCAAAIIVSFGLTPKRQPAEATPPQSVAMAGEPTA